MTGGPVGADCTDEGESTLFVAVGDVAAEGSEGSSHQLDTQFIAVLQRLTCDDVDGSAHRVGPVKDGSGSAGDFHAGGIAGEVFICHGVSVDGLELGMAVDQDRDTPAAGTETAQGDRSGRAVGDAVARDAA